MKKKNHYKSLSFRNLFPAPFIGFIIGSSALVFLAPGGHDMWHFFRKTLYRSLDDCTLGLPSHWYAKIPPLAL